MKKKTLTEYEHLLEGLNSAIQGIRDGTARRVIRSLEVSPVQEYSAKEIAAIRKRTGVSQELFAEFLGVTKRTIAAWENGTRKPSATTRRLLEIIDKDRIMKKYFIYS